MATKKNNNVPKFLTQPSLLITVNKPQLTEESTFVCKNLIYMCIAIVEINSAETRSREDSREIRNEVKL